MRTQKKVMIDRNGNPRIQEERGDTIRVYSFNDWQEELAKREAAQKDIKPAPKEKVDATASLVQKEDPTAAAPKAAPKKPAKARKSTGK